MRSQAHIEVTFIVLFENITFQTIFVDQWPAWQYLNSAS